jgi:hypothetical protein
MSPSGNPELLSRNRGNGQGGMRYVPVPARLAADHHELNEFVWQTSTRPAQRQIPGALPSIGWGRTGGLRRWVEFIPWERLNADDRFLRRRSDHRNFGCKQYSQLDDGRSNQHCHHARDVHVNIRQRFHRREPNGNDLLHADCEQFLWFDHIDDKSHGNRRRFRDRWFIGH